MKRLITPVSVPRWNSSPQVGIKICTKNSLNGDKKSIFFISKIPVGMVFECNFFHSISNGDKFIGQFPSGVETLGHFSQRGRFLGQFFQWGGGPPGLWHRGVWLRGLDSFDHSITKGIILRSFRSRKLVLVNLFWSISQFKSHLNQVELHNREGVSLWSKPWSVYYVVLIEYLCKSWMMYVQNL